MHGSILALIALIGSAAAAPPESATSRKKAPEFALFDQAGAKRTLAEFRGKVVILNFWATWCVPCIEEMPALDLVGREYGAKGLVVLGVAVDERGWPVVSKFLAQKRFGYPILMGTPEVARKYGGLKTLPHTVFIGRQGRIVATYSAALDAERLRRVVEAMLAEEP